MRHSVSEKQKKKGGRFTALVRLETGRLAVQGQSWLHETLSEKQSKNKARQTDRPTLVLTVSATSETLVSILATQAHFPHIHQGQELNFH